MLFQGILDLINHLDQKKDEAIDRTFKQISLNFSTVFKELVPNGKGTLVIQKKSRGELEDEQEERKESKGAVHSEIESFTGIGIQVQFTKSVTAKHQLSGGQESVVALSLIFAIQRCDPSPFYLFDEIDSALDPVHRTAVANMIATQKKETQFITTTFSPEMLENADKYESITSSPFYSVCRLLFFCALI